MRVTDAAIVEVAVVEFVCACPGLKPSHMRMCLQTGKKWIGSAGRFVAG